MKTTRSFWNGGSLGAISLACVLAQAQGQGTVQPVRITFEEPPPLQPTHGDTTEEYSESGMLFWLLGYYLPGGGFTGIAVGFPTLTLIMGPLTS